MNRRDTLLALVALVVTPCVGAQERVPVRQSALLRADEVSA